MGLLSRSFGAQFGVHVNQDTVGSLSLAGVAGHCITMVEMRMLAGIEFDRAATVHFQTQAPVFADVLDAVMRTMGHKDVKTAMQYQHPELEIVRAALDHDTAAEKRA
jgi:hypothetical protein